MKVLVTGATGLIGTALVPALREDGHQVVRLVRRPATGDDEISWDPQHRQIPDDALDGVDAVVHLAGVGVADKRWTTAHKLAVLDSRVDGTTTIAEAVARNADQVKVLVSASAVGWYGDRGDEILDEDAASGTGFLADVVRQWEGATAAASAAGVRVITIRSGVVLSPDGGALGKVLPIFKVGAGGRLGSGKQWMAWISLADEVAAIQFLLDADEVSGPVNLTAPEPVTNADYTHALGQVLNRPTVAIVPRLALKVALGDFADEGALVSQRVLPRKLTDAGFTFTYPTLDPALRSML